MEGYKEKMLILLVEKYRNSKKDSGTNVVRGRTSISPSELYKKYSKKDWDVEQIEKSNQAAQFTRRNDGRRRIRRPITAARTRRSASSAWAAMRPGFREIF